MLNDLNWRWAFVLASILMPAAILLYDPSFYQNPLVAFLLSLLIAFLSAIASRNDMLGEVKKDTQTEWLSQAESACDRLLTTVAQVKRLASLQQSTCGEAAKLLPEFESEELRSVRSLISSECRSTSVQLTSICEHLESAVSDWERFIRKNCESDECKTIGDALMKRRLQLAQIDDGDVICDSPKPLDSVAKSVELQ